MQTTKVGIQEFQENLSGYLESNVPVAITRRGATIGVYTSALKLPTWHKPTAEQMESYRVLGQQVQEQLAVAGIREDELVEDFQELRRRPRALKI